jgi:hypothetical protein
MSLVRSHSLELVKHFSQLQLDLVQTQKPGFVASFTPARLIESSICNLQVLHLLLEASDSLQDVLGIQSPGSYANG